MPLLNNLVELSRCYYTKLYSFILWGVLQNLTCERERARERVRDVGLSDYYFTGTKLSAQQQTHEETEERKNHQTAAEEDESNFCSVCKFLL